MPFVVESIYTSLYVTLLRHKLVDACVRIYVYGFVCLCHSWPNFEPLNA